MGTNFDWQTDTELTPSLDSSKLQCSWEMIGFWLTTAVIIILLTGGWFFSQRQLAQVDSEIRAELQALLDRQHQAFLAGDGDLFFTGHAPDPAWQAAQLLPFNQAAQRAGYTITRVQTNRDKVWANATWMQAGKTYQRLLFFEGSGSRYQQIPTDAAYWGELEQRHTKWGVIYAYEVDDEWTLDIISFVAAQCQQQCQTLTLMVTDEFSEIVAPHAIQIPSPRIFAINTAGQPAEAYWNLLEKRLHAYLNPATIRIALPPQNFLNLNLFDYEAAAAQFMAENPDIRVELITLDDMPTHPQQLAEFDGAAFSPSAAMIASGTVYDLTPLLDSDHSFDQGDFYEQLWQGAWWRDRLWFMPQAATMRLLFYNKELYRQAGLAEPSLRWTWAEMDEDLEGLAGTVTAVDSILHYTVFLDMGCDSLFSYAYNWQLDCSEDAAVRCQTALKKEQIQSAWAWQQQLFRSKLTPSLPHCEQARWNWQAAVRVEDPIYYEHFLQLSPLGVVPFPGSDRFDGITPLWLEGSFITQHSQHPLAVWRWLKFLSYQPPLPRYRLVPARPSVAQQTAYWQTLPRPLNEAMRTAFPFSRPVTIEDELWFDDGDMETAVFPQKHPALHWFNP